LGQFSRPKILPQIKVAFVMALDSHPNQAKNVSSNTHQVPLSKGVKKKKKLNLCSFKNSNHNRSSSSLDSKTSQLEAFIMEKLEDALVFLFP
jgi:hypothetical protein